MKKIIILILLLDMLYAIRPCYIARSDIISSQYIDIPDSLLSVDTLRISIVFKIINDKTNNIGIVKKVWMQYDSIDTKIWHQLEKYLLELEFTQPYDCKEVVRDSCIMGGPIYFIRK